MARPMTLAKITRQFRPIVRKQPQICLTLENLLGQVKPATAFPTMRPCILRANHLCTQIFFLRQGGPLPIRGHRSAEQSP